MRVWTVLYMACMVVACVQASVSVNGGWQEGSGVAGWCVLDRGVLLSGRRASVVRLAG